MATKYPELNWKAENIPEEFKIFKQRMELCLLDNNVTDKGRQAVKIILALGAEGLRRLNASSLTDEDKKDPAKIWTLFNDQLNTHVNFRIHRLELMRFKQQKEETVDDFVNRCRTKGAECDFTGDGLSERIIELVIASTPIEQFQKTLLDKPKGYTVDELLTEGRKYEAIVKGKKHLENLEEDNKANVSGITKGTKKRCRNCGRQHPPRKCPAYYSTCNACQKKGHWKDFCETTKRQNKKTEETKPPASRGKPKSARRKKRPVKRDKKVEEVNYETDDSESEDYEEDHTFYHIKVSNMCLQKLNRDRTEVFTTLDIKCPEKKGQHHLQLKIDTGAGGNTLPLRTIKMMYPTSWKKVIQHTKVKLTAYNDTSIPCLGKINLECSYNKSPWSTQSFFVVDVPGPAVAGLPTCERLQLVTINAVPNPTTSEHQNSTTYSAITVNSVEQLKEIYPEQFDRIGNFKRRAKLYLLDNATPSIDAPRKCSVHIKDKLKAEIQKMENLGIIRKIDHHTDWCSSLTTTIKSDGSLRVCLDPKRLNNSLKRCPHKIPTLEEINPMLARATHFSKLDAKAGYWSIHLDEDSQELTTFRTVFGRWCFQRLPFGLAVSQDIFQQEMDRITEQCEGCVSIADDLIIFGTSEEEHDRNLIKLMEVSKKEGLVFNSNKCTIKKSSINFFGALYTSSGIKPDPQKIEDLQAMPTPQNKDDLGRFLGFATYLANYIPNYETMASPLRDLQKKETPFVWQEDHQKVFDDLKQCLTSETCLPYFDPTKRTMLEVDASQKGLGACLLQGDRPVAFASKALSSSQTNYSNIERETLALVFGVTRFHTYLFGKRFTVFTDHKPLEMIWAKPLTSAPPRLQKLLVKLQGYDMEVIYKPGKSMVLSDTLSRLPNPADNGDVPLDVQVENIQLDLMNFGQRKQDAIQEETTKDPILRALSQVIYEGWPSNIKQLPQDLREFWCCRDELGIASGAVFKGRQVVIPESLRDDILRQLHIGHQGVEKTRRLARESVYWPGIYKDIENIVKACEVCQEYQPNQHKEPLQPHDVPLTPWTKLASDLFVLDGEDYLLLTDYQSKYPILYKLDNTRSETVAQATASIFSLLGPPKVIVSDNGPQYAGKPYEDMCRKWGIDHVTSSPRYPQSNGMAERMVRTVKALIKKCKKTKEDLHLAMLNLRATPVDSGIPSPAELLLGRPVRTTLPSFHPDTSHKQDGPNEKLKEKREKMKTNHDKHAGPDLAPLYNGQRVRVLNPETKVWEPAVVTNTCKEPKSYEVKTPNGSVLRRNRSHIRDMPLQKTAKTLPRKVQFQEEPDDSATSKKPAVVKQKPKPEVPQEQKATTTRSGRVTRKPSRYRDES